MELTTKYFVFVLSFDTDNVQSVGKWDMVKMSNPQNFIHATEEHLATDEESLTLDMYV